MYLEPSGWWRGRRRRSWLRTATLNAVGWSALLGLCLLTGVVGVVTAGALSLPRPLGAACAVIPLIGVVVADRRRWARMETGFGWGGSAVGVARIVAELESQGIRARVETSATASAWGERAQFGSREPVVETAQLCYCNRDAGAVAELLRQHGIRPPDPR